MNTRIFDQDRKIMNLLSEHQSSSLDAKLEQIVLMSHPNITFNGTQEVLKVYLRIERVEVDITYHPLAPVDKRPASGNCSMEKGERCEFRRTDGKCTSDPFDNEKCEFNDGHCDD
jgi:hypothetical protein